MKRQLPRLILAVSGVLLLVIGSAVLFSPESFAAANGVALPDNPSHLSEYRAPGGMLHSVKLLVHWNIASNRDNKH